MWIFLSVAIVVYGGMHAYAFAKVWQAFPHSWLLGLILATLAVALTLSPFMLWRVGREKGRLLAAVLSWGGYLWMGYLLLFCVTGLAFDLGMSIAALAGLNASPGRLPMLLAVALIALAWSGYGFFSARRLRIERIDIVTPKLREGALTIAQISDLHLGVMLGDALLQRVLRMIRKAQPDIVVVTGDIVDGQGDNLDRLAQQLHECAPARGKFAVLGNHEYFLGLDSALRFFRNAGFTVLRGEAVMAADIALAGVDDPIGVSLHQEARVNADAAIRALPGDAFVVLLKHQPVVDLTTPFDLQLSGHIHGGQLFPFNIVTRQAYGVKSGLTEFAPARWLYVSRGAGTWGPPMRVLAPAEITLITIASDRGAMPHT